jgi:hypothetical protein
VATSEEVGGGGGALNSWRISAHKACAKAAAEAATADVDGVFDAVLDEDGDLDLVDDGGLKRPRMVTAMVLPHTSQGAASQACQCDERSVRQTNWVSKRAMGRKMAGAFSRGGGGGGWTMCLEDTQCRGRAAVGSV